ncbi:hypothetical protein [Dysgonomonas massiliensis]|uniref:hypothetical protein n=1 Tax=Dysgonomonas massiliensis TaxID=2040292 RepID=UPI000C75B379|nr:hypothetical protein [Dysgonomonas massiliensis]
MNEFTKLNIACLKDMQMLLDVIADTVYKLDNALSIEQNKIHKYLKENLPTYFNVEEWEKDFDVFSQDDANESLLMPNIGITYSTTINKITKRHSIRCFDLYIGYLSDERQNVIYIQLFNDFETFILTELFISELKKYIPKEWKCDSDNNHEEPNIYIEFPLDEKFSTKKIEDCIQIFKDSILRPIIDKLQS